MGGKGHYELRVMRAIDRLEAWADAARSLEKAMDYQDMDWRDPAHANDFDRAALNALTYARRLGQP